MSLNNTNKLGFTTVSIYREKSESEVRSILSNKLSFWIATFSVLAFVLGNLVGQHGWYAVYKSVLGGGLEAQIVYDGTVPPVAKIPNYEVWGRYGGNSREHMYSQIPAAALMDLPQYTVALQNSTSAPSQYQNTYTVGFAGSYATGFTGDGYHNGVDIAMPQGTPVQSMMNGIVEFVGEKTGYGITVVIKHPNVPDADSPSKRTTLYSTYAHLQSYTVALGDVVTKGQKIAYSGQTGLSSGPHLHVQLDRETAPFIPFWANDKKTSTVQKYSVDPMLYVQAQFSASPVVVAQVTKRSAPTKSVLGTQRVVNRPAKRIVTRSLPRTPSGTVAVTSSSVSTVAVGSLTPIDHIEIRHSRTFTDGQWTEVRIIAKDSAGKAITNPNVDRGIYLKTAFGTAEFDKPILQSADFINGEAIVKMRSLEKRTVVIEIKPYGTLSSPLTYQAL